MFGITKGTPNKRRALEFIRFATGSTPLADEAEILPYGPARRSALAACAAAIPKPMKRCANIFRPRRENFSNALAVDPDWWAAHGADLEARWKAWRGS